VYRFAVKVPKGEAASFPVEEHRQVLEQVILTGADDQTLLVLLQSEAASPALKGELKKAVDLKAKLAATVAELVLAEKQLRSVTEDQARQRENLKVIPQADPAYRKYLERLLSQEGEIDRLRAQIARLQTAQSQQREAYEAFVSNLTVKE
jgi:hypothetical protein